MSAPKETWTILETLRWTTEYFRDKGVSEPRASAEVLLAHVLQVSRLDLYLRYDQPLAPEELARFKALVVRRREGEPVAYLTGHKEFWSLTFRVTPAVLIPRPETEVLVAAALEAAKDFGVDEYGEGGQGPVAQASRLWEPPGPSPIPPPPTPYEKDTVGAGLKPAPTKIGKSLEAKEPAPKPTLIEGQTKNEPPWGLELGVGSGAVVVALAKELPRMHWAALDLSAAALEVARENARRHGVAERISFLRADLLSALKPGERFALVVANLPYVPQAQWEQLPKDIKDYEPREALRAGEDGLSLIRPLARQAHRYLRAGGWLALEVGDGQAGQVLEFLKETQAYDRLETIPDYQGIARVVRGRRRFAG